VGDEGDDEGGHKGSETLEGEAELLRNASLDESSIGSSLGSNGATGSEIEVGDFLTEGRLEVDASNIAGDTITDVGQESVVRVRQNEPANANVDKIETMTRSTVAIRIQQEKHTQGRQHLCGTGRGTTRQLCTWR